VGDSLARCRRRRSSDFLAAADHPGGVGSAAGCGSPAGLALGGTTRRTVSRIGAGVAKGWVAGLLGEQLWPSSLPQVGKEPTPRSVKPSFHSLDPSPASAPGEAFSGGQAGRIQYPRGPQWILTGRPVLMRTPGSSGPRGILPASAQSSAPQLSGADGQAARQERRAFQSPKSVSSDDAVSSHRSPSGLPESFWIWLACRNPQLRTARSTPGTEGPSASNEQLPLGVLLALSSA